MLLPETLSPSVDEFLFVELFSSWTVSSYYYGFMTDYGSIIVKLSVIISSFGSIGSSSGGGFSSILLLNLILMPPRLAMDWPKFSSN